MRRLVILPALVLAALAAGGTAAGAGAAADTDINELLGRVRAAIGGARLGHLQSLSLSGTYRRVLGEREMNGDVELAFAFPDRFLRTETLAFGDPTNPLRRFSGFAGDTAIERTTGGGGMMMIRAGGPGGGSEEQRQARLMRVQQRDFGRLVVGLLAVSPEAFPVEFVYAGEAEAPDGRAWVIDVTGADRFTAQLFVDQVTHLPLMLAYRDVAPRIMTFGGPGGPGGGPGGRRPGALPSLDEIERQIREREAESPPPMADFQIYFSDHREVAGLVLPHRIQRALDGQVNEEWELTRIQVDPAFPGDKFATK